MSEIFPLAKRIGLMADAMVSAVVGPKARFFSRERVDEVVLLLREAEKALVDVGAGERAQRVADSAEILSSERSTSSAASRIRELESADAVPREPQATPTELGALRSEVGTVLRQLALTIHRADALPPADYLQKPSAADWRGRAEWLAAVLTKTMSRLEDEHLAHLRAVAPAAPRDQTPQKVACPNCGCDYETAADLRKWKDEPDADELRALAAELRAHHQHYSGEAGCPTCHIADRLALLAGKERT